MADTGVTPVPLPRYDLPNPGLPFGQQAVSPVMQNNPLMALNSGIMGGAQMGLQAGQLGLQAKQLAQQQQLQQAQIAQAHATILKEALVTAHADFDTLSKINPDMALDFYHNKIAPMQDEFWGKQGLKMDSSQIPPSHNNADAISQINQLTDLALSDPSKIPLARAGLAHLNNQMDLGEMVQKKIESSQKTIGDFESSNKHQDELASQWVQQGQSLRSDTTYKQLEAQRLAAGQGYDTLRKYQKPDGSFDLSNGQIIDLYGQLWKAQTGGVPPESVMKEMNQASLQKNYAKLTGLLNMSKNALPTELGNRLLSQFDNLGNFVEQNHAAIESTKNAMPGGLTDPAKIAAAQKALGRGMTFPEMKAKSDQEYQQRIQNKNIPTVTTQAQYDALPKGAQYIHNGRVGIKK